MLKSFKELKVWQKAYQLCLEMYKVTDSFPTDEKFGLISQIRRAAVSIPSKYCRRIWKKNNPGLCQVSIHRLRVYL
jgi:hypothetical protein